MTTATKANKKFKIISKAVRKFNIAIDAAAKEIGEIFLNAEPNNMYCALHALGIEQWKCHMMARCCRRFKTNKQFRIIVINSISKGSINAVDLDALYRNTPPELMGDPSKLVNKLTMTGNLTFSDIFNHLNLPFEGFDICHNCGSKGYIKLNNKEWHTVKCECCGWASKYYHNRIAP